MEGFTFSIREYASRVRSIDVVKCWPFDETANEEKVKSLLPPITIKKFSWWVDELQDFHNKQLAQNLEEVVKVKSLKGKSKAPKKRSMVEIFAVAPQVERVSSSGNSSDEDCFKDENGFVNSKWGVKGKRNEKKKKTKKKKNKDVMLSKGKQVIKKIKKRKAYKGVDSLSSLSSKGKHSKLKAQSQDKAMERLKSSYTEESEDDISDCPAVHKRRPNTGRRTVSKVFDLIDESEISALPKRNSFRKLANGFSREQSAECILQETIQVNDLHGKQKTAKHDTFSHNEDTVSLRRKPSPECFKLQKFSRSSTRNVTHEGNIGKDSTDTKRVENEMGTFSRYGISDRSEMQGIHAEMFDSSLREAPLDQTYACPREEYYNSPSIRLTRNSESSTYGTLDPKPTSVYFKDYLENNGGPSFSYLSYLEKAANIMPQVSSHSTALNDSHPSQCRTFSYLSPKEVLPAFFLDHLLQKRVITGIDKDFIGLPLNSHGEFIALNSSGKTNFDQMMKSSITGAPSTSLSMPRDYFSKGFGNPSHCEILDRRIFLKDQLNSFPVEAYAKENPVFLYPPTEDITESQSSGVTNLDLDLIKNDDHSYHSQKSMGKEDKRVQTSPETEKSQSTMRLMGKEFIVGRRSLQELEDVHTWKDKQMLDELQYCNNSISNLLVHDWTEPSLGKLGETLFYPSEIAINHGLGSRCIVPKFGHETSLMNPAEEIYPSFSPGTLSAVCNSGYESHVLSSSAIQLKNKQNLPHAKRSAFRFPFMHPDLYGNIQSSCSRGLTVNQPPLFIDASEKKMSMSDFQAYCNIGSNHLTISPLSCKPEVFYLHNSLSSGSTLQSSLAPASLPQNPLTQHVLKPVNPKVLPISSVQKTHANPKIRDWIKSKIGIRGPHHAKKGKRQVSAVSNLPLKSFKVPSLGSQEGSQRAIAKSRTHVNVEGGVQNNEQALESCSDIDTSKIVMREEERVCPWTDSNNDVARSGPTKLMAGTKHILKACQQIDQSCSISTYLGIPLGATSTGLKCLESENSKKIYRF